MAKPKKNGHMHEMLLDPSIEPEQKLELMKAVLSHPNQEAHTALLALLEGASPVDAESVAAQRAKQLAEIIKSMEEGPLRQAAFIEMTQPNGSAAKQAFVVLEDGAYAYTVVPDEQLGATLRRGDRVLLEARGRALLHRVANGLKVGEEAVFERKIDDRHIEVKMAADLRWVFLGSQDLMDQIQAGEVEPGATVVVNSKQAMAFAALPPQDGLSHYRFLMKGRVPDVKVERDIGAPPEFIEEVAETVRQEMTQPELRRRYKLRRCVTKLLAGVSGSGKTLAVQALHRRLYEVMSEVTGTPIEQLPPRVFRLQSSQIYSMWLGESDKNLDRFFSEVEQMADEKFVAPDGKEFVLPVLVIIEELDGLAKARGQDAVYDRILTTALQRLDSTRPELKDKLIVFIGTTNEPQQVDRAFLRRIGGTVINFGRLTRLSFKAVLQKHLTGLPVASHNGTPPEELQRHLTHDLVAWLFSPNGADKGIVELTYAGSTTPELRYRRHFLTGALVDLAVQQASEEAVNADHAGTNGGGVTLEQLMRAFDRQIRGVADQLSEHNAHHYLDVPAGARVAHLRRIPQPTLLPVELQRTENP